MKSLPAEFRGETVSPYPYNLLPPQGKQAPAAVGRSLRPVPFPAKVDHKELGLLYPQVVKVALDDLRWLSVGAVRFEAIYYQRVSFGVDVGEGSAAAEQDRS